MGRYVEGVAGFAALAPGTVLLDGAGSVTQALDAAEVVDGHRWAAPGEELLLTDEEVAAEGRRMVLRHGQRRDDETLYAPHDESGATTTEGLDSWSVDGAKLSVRSVGYDTEHVIAMCVSHQWAVLLAGELNASEVEQRPRVLAALARLADLQAEYGRQGKVWDRYDEGVRARVSAIATSLGLAPVAERGLGVTPKLIEIRDEITRQWAARHEWDRAAEAMRAELWPDDSIGGGPAQVMNAMAAEIRRLRREGCG